MIEVSLLLCYENKCIIFDYCLFFRELRKAAILRKYEDPAVWETMPEDIMIRRNEGYAAIEKHMQEKKISLCTVQAKEVLGDVETLLGLRYSCTYTHSHCSICMYKWASSWENVSSGVSDQVRLKLACSATEASMRLEILVTETRDITLSRQRTTKALIRLRGCAGWSAPLLFA